MRGLVVFLGFLLGGCGLDAHGLGQGEGGASSMGETTRGEPGETGETGATTTSSIGTGHGSEASSSGPADGSSTSTADTSTADASTADTSTADTSTADTSTTGTDIPVLPCDPAPELAACYDFVEVGSGTLWDRSGNGNDAPALGVGVIDGPFGEAATFADGSEISVPDSPSLDLPGPLTLEAWILVDALPATGRVGIVDNDGQYGFTIHSDDQYRCAIADATVFVGPVVLGQWSHVACVLDGAFLRVYVDGTEQGTAPATDSAGTANGDPMSVGDTSPDFDEPLTGAMGGLRIWGTALDPTAICEAAGDACSP